MHQLDVIVLDELHVASTPEELGELLGARADGGNHFQIAAAGSGFPMLDVMVRDRYAVVHYFADDAAVGDQAYGAVADAPDEVDFPHSAWGDVITMPGSVLVDVALALGCVEEFARTLSRPSVVEWLEL